MLNLVNDKRNANQEYNKVTSTFIPPENVKCENIKCYKCWLQDLLSIPLDSNFRTMSWSIQEVVTQYNTIGGK